MVSFEEALDKVLSMTRRLEPEEMPLDSICGKVLAEDVLSTEDIPPFSRSTMDGYAVRSEDFRSGGRKFRIVEEIPAGAVPNRRLGEGQVARIFTGGMLPDGADAVIIQEKAEREGEQLVRFSTTPAGGQFIINSGEIARRGELLLPRGFVINPPAVALLASQGTTRVLVFPAPRVSVFSTGDELVEPATSPGPGQIRDSNSAMLLSLLESAGAEREYLGIARDNPDSLRALIGRGLSADILIISGGVSVGEHDLVAGQLKALGVEPIVYGVAIKPGKPFFFGRKGKTAVFGLPGNPASSLVAFELFIRPAISRMRGYSTTGPEFRPGTLACPIDFPRDRLTFLPARMSSSPEGTTVQPLKWAGSADIRAMVDADCLVAVPAGRGAISAGSKVDFLVVQSAGDCS